MTRDLVPLSRAALCLDCECISASTGNCVGCKSRALLPLAKVFNERDGSASIEQPLVSITNFTTPREIARRLLAERGTGST